MSNQPTRRIAIKNILAGTAAGIFGPSALTATGMLSSLDAAAAEHDVGLDFAKGFNGVAQIEPGGLVEVLVEADAVDLAVVAEQLS